MRIKGLFKNAPFSSQLILFFAIFLLSNIVVSIPFSVVMRQDAVFLRIMFLVNHLGTFVFSALFSAYLFSDDVKTYLKVGNGISRKVTIYVILSMLVVLPFLNLTVQFNEAMKLPEWMRPLEEWMIVSEKAVKQLTDTVLNTGSWMDLIANLLIIGVLAAVGEELLFRGVLQNIFGGKIKNKHVVIWLVAILFSAIHLQFYGFIPRMLMGAYFGYLLYYTRSIWAPVLAHFTNNAFAVLISYRYRNTSTPEDLSDIGTIGHGWWLALISLILWYFLFIRIVKHSKKG
jgi:membrane protease YdiL (CAAX protease family)